MDRVSSVIGTKNLDVSLGLMELGINTYTRHQINLDPGYITAGMQKLADRFIITLFNLLGSTKHDENFGTELVTDVMIGSAMNFGIVQSNVAIAVSSAASQIISDDESEDYQDTQDEDEMLDSAVCDSVEYDVKTGALKLYVTLTNKAGEEYTYVLPVNLEFPA